jgi:very-short-patch-repair endonuclease
MIAGIPISEDLIKHLRRKLSRGNLSSIQLNCLPQRSKSKFDLAGLNLAGEGMAGQFVHKLLKQKTSFKYTISLGHIPRDTADPEVRKELGHMVKRLDHLALETKTDKDEFGYETFGFGFPVVSLRPAKEPNKVIKAPLFIWKMELVKNRKKPDTWHLERSQEYEVQFNEVLRSYIYDSNNVFVEGFDDDLTDSNHLTADTLKACTSRFLKQLTPGGNLGANAWLEEAESRTPKPLPPKEQIEQDAMQGPRLYWSGVFGRFNQKNEALSLEVKKHLPGLLGAEEESGPLSEPLRHSETALSTDPSQAGILNYLSRNKHLVIQGPPGTGKSRSLTSIILNALEQEKSVLVVCEKKTAMDVLYDNLSEVSPEIGSLVAVVDDAVKDRKKTVESVRDRHQNNGQQEAPASKGGEMSYRLDQIEQKIEHIHRNKQFLHNRPVITETGGTYSWSSSVNEFLKAKLRNGEQSLRDKIKKLKLKDDVLPLVSGAQALKELEEQAAEVDFEDYLDFLTDLSVQQGNPVLIKEELEKLLDLDTDALRKFIRMYDVHTTELHRLTEQQLQQTLDELEREAAALLEDAQILMAQSFFKSRSMWYGVLRVFSGLSAGLREAVNAYEQVPQRLDKMKQSFNLLELPHHIETRRNPDVEVIYSDAKRIETRIRDIRQRLPELKVKYYNQLFERPALGIEMAAPIRKQLSRRLHQLRQIEACHHIETGGKLKELNNFESFREGLRLLLELGRKWNGMLGKGFFVHYDWQKKLRPHEENFKRLVGLLRSTRASDWSTQYREYLHDARLTRNFDIAASKGYDAELRQLHEMKAEIQREIKKSIPAIWQRKQHQAASGRDVKRLFNLRGAKGHRRNSLRKIIGTAPELFSSFYPVLMVNPGVCAQIVPLRPQLFDLVIFDEASQLKVEESISTLIRGERKIISGDKHQMPPSYYFSTKADDLIDEEEDDEIEPPLLQEIQPTAGQSPETFQGDLLTAKGAAYLNDSESLLEFAENCRFKSTTLDFHYRSYHPLLIQFSNAVFYKNKLHPLPERFSNPPIQFIQVDGLYKNRQNRDEAEYVLKALRDIRPDDRGELPSVGIATFNLDQRNLIWETLIRESNLDEDFSGKLTRLEEKGLFIKNLENIQGDERDMMIISTTYGKNAQDKFQQRFGPLTYKGHGRRLLNVLITRARKKIVVLTSISSSYYMRYKDELRGSAKAEKGYLYAWLTYARAVSEQDVQGVENVLKFFDPSAGQTVNGSVLTESPLEEGVYEALCTQIDPERILLQHEAGGFRIDIAIRSLIDNKPYLAIECDGAAYHSSAEDYARDMFRQERLEEHGFVFHRIWSRDWWENSGRELDKLVDFIDRHDEETRQRLVQNDPIARHLEIVVTPEEGGQDSEI